MASSKDFELSSETLGTKIVTIYVGPRKKAFKVHKKLICDRSDYFSKAFTGGFQEAKKGIMYLPEEDDASFDALINYIYRDNLPLFPSNKYPATDLGGDKYTTTCLVPLFFMAERLCQESLANKIMDAIQDVQLRQEIIFRSEALPLIYEGTGENSKLRLYAILCNLTNLMVGGDPENDEVLGMALAEVAGTTPQLAADFIYLLGKHAQTFRKIPPPDPQIRNDEKGFGKCYFHTHRKGQKCHLDEDE